MAAYEFVTLWRFDWPVEPVWSLIRDNARWHEWWRGVLRVVEIEPGDADGIGAIHRSTWKSRLPYKLEFDSEVVKVDHLRLIEVRAFGELEGRGIWQFGVEEGGKTLIRYDWQVSTNKKWMNLIAPAARPLFKWNHDVIMRWGEEGLKRRLIDA